MRIGNDDDVLHFHESTGGRYLARSCQMNVGEQACRKLELSIVLRLMDGARS